MNTLHCSEGSDDIRWPRHHVSAGEDSRLGNQLTEFTARDKVHIVAMTGSYNRQTDQNGTERYGCELVAEQVDFLAKAKEAKAADASQELALAYGRAPYLKRPHSRPRRSLSGASLCVLAEKQLRKHGSENRR
jgi:hypothetical protein